MSATAAQSKQDVRDGLIAGLIAYTLWGILPVYFKLVESVSSTEVLLHRIIWAIPFGALIIHLRRQWPDVAEALKHRQMLLWLTLTAVLIAVNWYVYIVAIQTDRIFQASLGYYINPLIFVVAGVFLFGEKLRGMQTAAVVLAAIGVLVLTFSGGEFPAISLFLGTSFTIYGVVRKRIVIGAMPGLFIETLVLVPIAMIWLGWMFSNGQAEFGYAGPGITGLLLLAGADYSRSAVDVCHCCQAPEPDDRRFHAISGTDDAVRHGCLLRRGPDLAEIDLFCLYLDCGRAI